MLRTALAAAAAGRGGVVVVRGETGIGKSRLLEELAAEASATHVVLTGRAIEGGGAFRPIADALVGALRAGHEITPAALGPYGAALARLLPDWTEAAGGSPPETGVDPGLVLGEAVARFLGLVGQVRPCLLILEDLQWADADSWAVLAHVAVAAVTLPVLVVATVRDDGPLSAPAAGLARLPAVTTLRLERLSPAEVRGLAAALGATDPATLGVLDERSDGLPFLVEELVEQRLSGTGGVADVPPTLRGLVEERFQRLTDIQRRVLAGAAVLGVDPDWSFLHRVTDVPERDVLEALGAVERVRLLVVDGGTLRWRHSLTRDAVLSLLLPPEVASLSRRAAEALVARGRPDDVAAAADLLLRAGAFDAVAELLLPLARRELARGGLLTAERLLDDLDRTGLRRAAAATERSRLLCLHGRAREALELAGPVLDEATGADHVELALGLARAAVQAGQWDDVREYVARAGRPDDPRSQTLLADAAHGAGRLDVARRHADRAVAGAQDTGDAAQLCDALVVSAKIVRLSDTRAARRAFDRAAQLAAEHGLVDQRVEAVLGLATLDMLESDDPARLEVARGLAEQAGLVGQLTGIDMLRVDALVMSSGPAAAVPLAHELAERGRALAMIPAALAGAYVAALAPAAAGDRAETGRLLGALLETPDGPPETALVTAGVSAMLALASHDLRAANSVLDPAASRLVSHHSAAPAAPVRSLGAAAHGGRRPWRRSAGGARADAGVAPPRQRRRAPVRRGCGRGPQRSPGRRGRCTPGSGRPGQRDALAASPDLAVAGALHAVLSGPVLQEFPLGAAAPDVLGRLSPSTYAVAPQDHLEPVLLAHLLELGGEVRFGVRVNGLVEHEDGVSLTTTHDGSDETIDARWVVGADGADSTLRRLVGLDVEVLGDEGAHLSTLFRADLSRHLNGARYALHMVVKGEEFQVFVPSGTDGRWMYDRELHPERGDSAADWTEDRAVAAIRQAAGVPDLDIEVIGSFPWTFAAAVASGVQAGRAFLVGDAAHRTTPRGATGMNTGIADGHNLGWKLGWVARGLAGESLLATYAEERYPVGLHNALASLEAFARIGAPT